MVPELRNKFIKGYDINFAWKNTMETVKKNIIMEAEDQACLPFGLKNGLLWKDAADGMPDRLYVPRDCIPQIFAYIHRPSHLGYNKLREEFIKFVIKNNHR